MLLIIEAGERCIAPEEIPSMSLPQWLRPISRLVPGGSRRVVRRGKRPQKRCLALEALEDRITPAPTVVTTITLTNNDPHALINAINLADATITGPNQTVQINLLANATYTLTGVDNYWYGPNGLPPIDNNITIAGNGATITRSSGTSPDFRFFYVSGGLELPGGTLTLQDLTLSNGVAKGGDGFSGGGGGLGAGGAIFNQGSVTLQGVTLNNNQAIGGAGGTFNGSTFGGGGGMGSSADTNGNGGGFGGILANGPYGGGGGAGSNGGGGGGGGGFRGGANDSSGLSGSGATGGNGGGRGLFGGSGGAALNTAGIGGDGGGGGAGDGNAGLSGASGAAFGFGGSGSGLEGGGGGGVGGGGGGGNTGGGGGGFGGGGGYNGGAAGFGAGAGGTGGSGGQGGSGLGGAIFNMGAAFSQSGVLNVINSTLTGDSAIGGAGGSGGAGGNGFGGAIFSLDGFVSLVYATDDANTVTAGLGTGAANGGATGGALYNLASNNNITNGNAVGSNVTLANSILATTKNGGIDLYNAGVVAADTTLIDGETSMVENFSLQNGPGAANPIVTPSPITLLNFDPHLGPLANNGGPTATQLLLPPYTMVFQGATPINGTVTFQNGTFGPITTDQRGQPRSATVPSMGAVEVQPANTTAVNQTTTYTVGSQVVQLTANVVDPNNNTPVTTGLVTFTVQDSHGNTIGTAVMAAPNASGTAMANYTLPGNTPVGTYTIVVTYSDSTNNVFDNGDTSATLTINAAKATVAAQSSAIPFSSTMTSVSLSATVTSTGGPVNEGFVTFTLHNSSGVTIGTATASNTVVGGAASVNYAVPAPLAGGTYTVLVTYTDTTPGNFVDDGTDTSGTLTVNAAHVTANNSSITYSQALSSVSLSATVTSPTGTVNEGSVTFTLEDSLGHVIGVAQAAPVSSGAASVNYALSGPLNAGTYKILVSYTDTFPGKFGDDGTDASGTLTVSPAPATVTGGSSSLTYNPAQTSVTVSATVGSTGGTVSEGTVTFTVENSLGIAVAAPVVSPTVSHGTVSATVLLSSPLAAGTYKVAVSYTDLSPGNFADNGIDTPGTLTVSAISATTTAQPATINFSSTTQSVNLFATVSSSSGTVNEGKVTFTVLKGSTTIATGSGSVIAGTAQASVLLPAGQPAGQYTLQVKFTDTSPGNFTDGGDVNSTLTINPAPTQTFTSNYTVPASNAAQFLPVSATVNAPGQPPVTGGAVTFTLDLGNGQTVAAIGLVSGGSAAATLTVPAGLAAGTYGLSASYGPTANFGPSSDISHHLTVTGTSSSSPSSSSSITGTASSFTVSSGFFGVTVQAFDSSGNQVGPNAFLSIFQFPFPLVGSVSFDGSGNMTVHLTGLFFGLFGLPLNVVFSPSGAMLSVALA
jgi:hypothetical protein